MTADAAAHDATRLARKLAALPEDRMREVALIEYLEHAEPTSAAAVLDHIRRRGNLGGPPFDVALLALGQTLAAGHLEYEVAEAIYEAAKEQQLEDLMHLFFSTEPPADSSQQASAEDRELTLGHRKTLARTGDHDAIARLLRAPEAEVVPHLLANPRTTERHVVRLIARRPAIAAVQRLVADHPRWISRYPVKRALILNPSTPSDIALRLIPFLLHPDLKLVANDPRLSETVKQTAAAAVKTRRGT